jgi:hypothetical protein
MIALAFGQLILNTIGLLAVLYFCNKHGDIGGGLVGIVVYVICACGLDCYCFTPWLLSKYKIHQ